MRRSHGLTFTSRRGSISGSFCSAPTSPNPQHPHNLGWLASGARMQIVDYAPAIEGKLNPKPLSNGGEPALHFTISTAMMNQHLDSWLLADDPQHGNFSMGLANVELKRG